ncbi:hypothetical protein EDD86DRAFT_197211 [Gorgonomyces haynaldii]|nr:hypothetical protein EDD86DRAFT_197211 [Gorgonomyces haynaldii]
MLYLVLGINCLTLLVVVVYAIHILKQHRFWRLKGPALLLISAIVISGLLQMTYSIAKLPHTIRISHDTIFDILDWFSVILLLSIVFLMALMNVEMISLFINIFSHGSKSKLALLWGFRVLWSVGFVIALVNETTRLVPVLNGTLYELAYVIIPDYGYYFSGLSILFDNIVIFVLTRRIYAASRNQTKPQYQLMYRNILRLLLLLLTLDYAALAFIILTDHKDMNLGVLFMRSCANAIPGFHSILSIQIILMLSDLAVENTQVEVSVISELHSGHQKTNYK